MRRWKRRWTRRTSARARSTSATARATAASPAAPLRFEQARARGTRLVEHRLEERLGARLLSRREAEPLLQLEYVPRPRIAVLVGRERHPEPEPLADHGVELLRAHLRAVVAGVTGPGVVGSAVLRAGVLSFRVRRCGVLRARVLRPRGRACHE